MEGEKKKGRERERENNKHVLYIGKYMYIYIFLQKHACDSETFACIIFYLIYYLHVLCLSIVQFGGEMSELDDAGTYFDLGPQKVTQSGVYYYMCSRNNNFTNRSQKGKIIVSRNALTFGRIGWNGGSVTLNK